MYICCIYSGNFGGGLTGSVVELYHLLESVKALSCCYRDLLSLKIAHTFLLKKYSRTGDSVDLYHFGNVIANFTLD